MSCFNNSEGMAATAAVAGNSIRTMTRDVSFIHSQFSIDRHTLGFINGVNILKFIFGLGSHTPALLSSPLPYITPQICKLAGF